MQQKEVEKQFLEQEHKMWKLHILQEIYIAEAEENVTKRILNKEVKWTRTAMPDRNH